MLVHFSVRVLQSKYARKFVHVTDYKPTVIAGKATRACIIGTSGDKETNQFECIKEHTSYPTSQFLNLHSFV